MGNVKPPNSEIVDEEVRLLRVRLILVIGFAFDSLRSQYMKQFAQVARRATGAIVERWID